MKTKQAAHFTLEPEAERILKSLHKTTGISRKTICSLLLYRFAITLKKQLGFLLIAAFYSGILFWMILEAGR